MVGLKGRRFSFLRAVLGVRRKEQDDPAALGLETIAGVSMRPRGCAAARVSRSSPPQMMAAGPLQTLRGVLSPPQRVRAVPSHPRVQSQLGGPLTMTNRRRRRKAERRLRSRRISPTVPWWLVGVLILVAVAIASARLLG